jgi:hypothetical protein
MFVAGLFVLQNKSALGSFPGLIVLNKSAAGLDCTRGRSVTLEETYWGIGAIQQGSPLTPPTSVARMIMAETVIGLILRFSPFLDVQTRKSVSME